MPRLSNFCLSLICLSMIMQSATAQYKGAIAPPQEWSEGFKTITDDQAKQWVALLAGPNFKGRGTGQPGYLKAAFFMAGKLAEYGFEPIGDNGTYFQNLPFARLVPDPKRSSAQAGEFTLPGDQIGFTRFGGGGKVSGSVVFVKGVGASARLGDLNKYKDKVVIVAAKDARRLSRELRFARPKAVINVLGDDEKIENIPVNTRSSLRQPGTIIANISESSAKKLAKASGVDPQFVVVNEKDSGAISKATETALTINLAVVDQPVFNPNVVGWLEGSDPELKHEHIIIGAHLDHLGVQGRGLFPGADDNASGSTAVLQVAKALSVNKTRPKRSVLIMWFAAEEIGLVGSRHYANNPLKPVKDCICMLNIDMIGRNEEKNNEPASENEDTIHLVGTQKLTPNMHQTMLAANKYVGYKFEYDEEDVVFTRSDQASFHDKGIPVAFVFGGFNPHYHQTTDTIKGINFSKISNCARLYFAATFLAAQKGHIRK